MQLSLTMLYRTFSKHVHNLASAFVNPVDTFLSVNKTENLDIFQFANLLCIPTNHPDGIFFSFRNPCRTYFNPVDIDVVEKHFSNYKFLVRKERNPVSLFAVTQRTVHYLDKRLYACIRFYISNRSHFSILSLFCNKKSMSSSPFIKQYFLYPLMSKCSLFPVALLVTI